MKKHLLAGIISLAIVPMGFAQTALTLDFTGSTLDTKWQVEASNPSYTLSHSSNKLSVVMTDSVGPQQAPPGSPASNWKSFWYSPISPSIDMRTNKVITVDIDASTVTVPFVLALQPQDGTGKYCDDNVGVTVAAGYVGTLTFNYASKFRNLYGSSPGLVDSAAITQLNIQAIGEGLGASPWNKKFMGSFTLDNLAIGGVTSGVNDAASQIASSKLFPNPVSDMANVSLNLKSAQNVKVTLSDAMGKEVMNITEGTFTELNKSFDVSNLSKGVYTVNYFINGAAAKSELLMVK